MKILETNVVMSCMILVILLFRIVGRTRLSKTMVVHLWNVVLLRALIPLERIVIRVPFVRRGMEYLSPSNGQPDISGLLQRSRGVVLGYGEQEAALKSGAWVHTEYMLLLWLAGAVCLAVYFLRIYIREYRKLKAGQPVRNDTAERLIQKRGFAREVCLEINPAFLTPVTYGIIHPKIVLPSDLADITRTDLRNMMFHELIHIQRCDVVKRHLMILLLCVYWFNPLIWIMFFLYQSDQEMSCDECVIRSMEEQRVKSYIQTIIKMSVEEKGLLAHTGFRGKLSGKKRILAAMRQRSAKRGKGWAAAAIVLCLCPALLNAYRTSEISGKGVEEVGEAADLETIQPLLRIEAETEEPFDYQAVMKDIEENYNDLSQPLTQEQELALTIQRMLRIQEIKERVG